MSVSNGQGNGQDSQAHDGQACGSNSATVQVLNSANLLRGMTEVLIAHGDELYRLRVTKNGKLLLQK